MAATSQEHEEGVQSGPRGSRKRRAEASWGIPTAQNVLKVAAFKYLQTTDASNGFVYYLEKVRKVVIVDVQPGSLIITVECGSQQLLDELWNDYCTGVVNEMAHKFLVTKDILNELGLTEVKLTTTIPREEYIAYRQQLQHFSSELEWRKNQLKDSRNELLNQFRHWVIIRDRTRNLLSNLKILLSRRVQQERRRFAVVRDWIVSSRLGALLGFVDERAAIERLSNEVHQALDEDRKECQKLKAKEFVLARCVADFAVFCREHIDSVMSSELVEGELGFLLDILRGTRSHGGATIAEARQRPTLLDEEMDIYSRESTPLERLQRPRSNQEALMITQQILLLQECPNEEEIQRRITEFMETKFAEACTSQL